MAEKVDSFEFSVVRQLPLARLILVVLTTFNLRYLIVTIASAVNVMS